LYESVIDGSLLYPEIALVAEQIRVRVGDYFYQSCFRVSAGVVQGKRNDDAYIVFRDLVFFFDLHYFNLAYAVVAVDEEIQNVANRLNRQIILQTIPDLLRFHFEMLVCSRLIHRFSTAFCRDSSDFGERTKIIYLNFCI
jgi:hypothetical protein